MKLLKSVNVRHVIVSPPLSAKAALVVTATMVGMAGLALLRLLGVVLVLGLVLGELGCCVIVGATVSPCVIACGMDRKLCIVCDTSWCRLFSVLEGPVKGCFPGIQQYNSVLSVPWSE